MASLLLATSTAIASDAVASDPALREGIAGALVVPDGARFRPYRWQRAPEIIALYFGADWCGPCHAFVPTLREVRDALRAGGADTEVVYVSLDANESDMRRYMGHQAMPWPAIDHRRLRTLPQVRALGGPAPPALVLLDRDGKVLASAWDGRRYLGLQPVLQAWATAAVAAVHSDQGKGDP